MPPLHSNVHAMVVIDEGGFETRPYENRHIDHTPDPCHPGNSTSINTPWILAAKRTSVSKIATHEHDFVTDSARGNFVRGCLFTSIAQRKIQEMTMDKNRFVNRFEIKNGSTYEDYQKLRESGEVQKRSLRARRETTAEGEIIVLFRQHDKQGLFETLENLWVAKEQKKLAEAYCASLEKYWETKTENTYLDDRAISSIHTYARENWIQPKSTDANKKQSQELELELKSVSEYKKKPTLDETAKSIPANPVKPLNPKDVAKQERLRIFQEKLKKFLTNDQNTEENLDSLSKEARALKLQPEALRGMVSASITAHLETLTGDALWQYFSKCMKSWSQAQPPRPNDSQLPMILRACLCKGFLDHPDANSDCGKEYLYPYLRILRHTKMPELTQLATKIENRIYKEYSEELEKFIGAPETLTLQDWKRYINLVSDLGEDFLVAKSLPTLKSAYEARLVLTKKEFLPILNNWKKEREQALNDQKQRAEIFHQFLQKVVELNVRSGMWSDLLSDLLSKVGYGGDVKARTCVQFLHDITEAKDRALIRADAEITSKNTNYQDPPHYVVTGQGNARLTVRADILPDGIVKSLENGFL